MVVELRYREEKAPRSQCFGAPKSLGEMAVLPRGNKSEHETLAENTSNHCMSTRKGILENWWLCSWRCNLDKLSRRNRDFLNQQ